MFGPEDAEGCPGCSYTADSLDGVRDQRRDHLPDLGLVAVDERQGRLLALELQPDVRRDDGRE